MTDAPTMRTGERAVTLLTSLVVALVGLLAVQATGAAPADASARLGCDHDAVYALAADGTVRRVQADTGAVDASVAVQAGGRGGYGGLGVTSSGRAVDDEGSTVVEHGRSTTRVRIGQPLPDTGAGAVDPTTGTYYAGRFHGSTLELRGVDLAARRMFPGTTEVTLPGAPGDDGDFAFDAAGRLYVVASSAHRAALYVTATLPARGSAATTTTGTRIRTAGVTGPVTGVAFASDAHLYLATAHAIQRVDPVTGVGATPKPLGAGLEPTDLGSCASPSLPTVRTARPNRSAGAVPTAPAVAVSATTDPATVVRSGQTLRSTVTAVNTGGQPLDDLVVTATGPGLPALSCAPVRQGGTLTAGASTTCTASRTSTQDDLRAGGGAVDATATGFAPDGTPVTGSATVKIPVDPTPPVVTDDRATVVLDTTSVLLAGSTNDAPAHPGGPAIDGTKTVLGQAGYGFGPTSLQGTYGTFDVQPDGSVGYVAATGVFAVAKPRTGYSDTMRYRTFDLAGRHADGSLTVTYRRGPVATPRPVSVEQGARTVVDVLGQVEPGEQQDGSDAALVPATLRFTSDQPVGDAQVTAAGDGLTIPWTGTFRISGGKVVVTPDPSFSGSVSVGYSVEDSAGDRVSSTLQLAVVPIVVAAHPHATVTTYETPATFGWSTLDTSKETGAPVHVVGFVSRDGADDLGTVRGTPQGVWSYQPVGDASGPITFVPAAGFSGTAIVHYALADANGTRGTSVLSVTVRSGPIARPDLVTTRAGVDVTLDPGLNDTPGQHLDGSAGAFVPRWAVFPVAGQPSGAAVADGGKTLTLPGRGRLWFTAGKVTFRPQPGFTGLAGQVAYQLEDDSAPSADGHGHVALGALTLVVTSDAPVATDDTAGTILDRPVTLPASTDDPPGSAARPLPTTFPAGGQPAGAVVSAGGTTLSVPGQGVWLLATSGSATFTPAPGFVGRTTAVTYRITGTAGAAATATLQVTVAPGPSAGSDVFLRPEAAAVDERSVPLRVDPLTNDVPGRRADGRLGTLDPASVRFPVDGQPSPGAPSADGLTFDSGLTRFEIDQGTGLITVITDAEASSGELPPVRYTVDDNVTDATGRTVHQRTSATLRVTLVGRGPTATDDSAVIPRYSGGAVLPGPLNDIPGSGRVPIDPERVSFPADQLDALPAGSSIRYLDGDNDPAYWYADVPGEGFWTTDPYTSRIFFQPREDFVGTTTPLRYRVFDVAGNQADAFVRVTVLPEPRLVADSAVTKQGIAVVVHPYANDTFTRNPDGSAYDYAGNEHFDQSQVPAGATVPNSSDVRLLVFPGQGRYLISRTGDVTFRPDATFRGSTTPVYVRFGSTSSRLQIRVDPVDPAASDDRATTAAGTPVRIPVLTNDVPGAAERPLLPGSLRLQAPAGLPTGTTAATDGRSLAVPGRGVFAAAGDGTVTFYPRVGTTGTTPAVGYTVEDANGTRAGASLRVAVG